MPHLSNNEKEGETMKKKYRIVISSSRGITPSTEHVTITEDFDMPVEEFLFPHEAVDFDGVRELNLPPVFPFESTLTKAG